MDMPTNGLALALINSTIFTREEIHAFLQRAFNVQLGLAQYLYEHQHLTAHEIIKLSETYYGLQTIEEAAIQAPRFDRDIIYFTQDDQPCAALIDPNDIQLIQPSHRLFIIPIPLFFKLKSIKKPTDQSATDHSIIEQLNQLLWHAFKQEASDIHIEPTTQGYQVRQRIHGDLTHHIHLDSQTAQRLIMRLKVIAEIDVTQHQLAQDGRFTFHHAHHRCDCRLNICPAIDGEKAVIRLLNPQQRLRSLDELGFHPQQRQLINVAITQTQGLILVTGPTGAGKTQTLYSLIQQLRDTHRNISTIEDPVEIRLPGINQFNVNERQGFHTSHILRALLRQDPDVIMVGEIRDSDTATLAIRAAQTGHLVLATLHTQDCIETIFRLQHLSISAHEIASALTLIINQRLVRCLPTQTSHRHSVFECLMMNTSINMLIENKATRLSIQSLLDSTDFISLWQHGCYLVDKKIISMDQIEPYRHANLQTTH